MSVIIEFVQLLKIVPLTDFWRDAVCCAVEQFRVDYPEAFAFVMELFSFDG